MEDAGVLVHAAEQSVGIRVGTGGEGGGGAETDESDEYCRADDHGMARGDLHESPILRRLTGRGQASANVGGMLGYSYLRHPAGGRYRSPANPGLTRSQRTRPGSHSGSEHRMNGVTGSQSGGQSSSKRRS